MYVANLGLPAELFSHPLLRLGLGLGLGSAVLSRNSPPIRNTQAEFSDYVRGLTTSSRFPLRIPTELPCTIEYLPFTTEASSITRSLLFRNPKNQLMCTPLSQDPRFVLKLVLTPNTES